MTGETLIVALVCLAAFAIFGCGRWAHKRHTTLVAADEAVLANEVPALLQCERDAQVLRVVIAPLNAQARSAEALLEEADRCLVKAGHGFATPILETAVVTAEQRLAAARGALVTMERQHQEAVTACADIRGRLEAFRQENSPTRLRTNVGRQRAQELWMRAFDCAPPSLHYGLLVHGVESPDITARARAREAHREKQRQDNWASCYSSS